MGGWRDEKERKKRGAEKKLCLIFVTYDNLTFTYRTSVVLAINF